MGDVFHEPLPTRSSPRLEGEAVRRFIIARGRTSPLANVEKKIKKSLLRKMLDLGLCSHSSFYDSVNA